jgi:hypothetical protein
MRKFTRLHFPTGKAYWFQRICVAQTAATRVGIRRVALVEIWPWGCSDDRNLLFTGHRSRAPSGSKCSSQPVTYRYCKRDQQLSVLRLCDLKLFSSWIQGSWINATPHLAVRRPSFGLQRECVALGARSLLAITGCRVSMALSFIPSRAYWARQNLALTPDQPWHY